MTPLFALDHLRVRFGSKEVVRDVSLRVERGQLLALLGPNGSGKTSLLRAALGLIPASGQIAWEGDTTHVSLPGRLASIAAYLPQSPTMLAGQTVADAILTGRFVHRGRLAFLDAPSDRAAAHDAAVALGLTDLLERPLAALSGGQRQRVFLARCLAQGSPALVLDEPATFLDLRHQVELYRLLRTLVRDHGRTVIMACHDLNLAATHCDRMLLLADGELVADGPPERVMDPALVERVFGVPMRRVEVNGRPHLVPDEPESAAEG